MQQMAIVVAQHLFPLRSICARLAQRQPARRSKGNNRSDCLSQHGTGRHTGERERKVRNADVSSCKGEIGNVAGIQTAPMNGIWRRNRVKDIWLFSTTEAIRTSETSSARCGDCGETCSCKLSFRKQYQVMKDSENPIGISPNKVYNIIIV